MTEAEWEAAEEATFHDWVRNKTWPSPRIGAGAAWIARARIAREERERERMDTPPEREQPRKGRPDFKKHYLLSTHPYMCVCGWKAILGTETPQVEQFFDHLLATAAADKPREGRIIGDLAWFQEIERRLEALEADRAPGNPKEAAHE